MTKILVAYDGSECSDKALRDLRKAGLPERAEAVVLTLTDAWAEKAVLDPAMNPQYPALLGAGFPWLGSALKEAENTAKKAAERLNNYFPLWEIQPESASDSPAHGLIRKIEAWKPDLVVMGSHGRSQAGQILFGSVSHKVLSHAPCNLRISRSRDEADGQMAPLRIVVGFDGSEESETALETALSRAWPKGTAIRLVTVIDTRITAAFAYPTAPIRYWMKTQDADPVAWVERMLADQKHRIEEKGYIAYSEALKGDPKRMLLKEAEQWGADSIFVGSRGLTRRERLLMGSVSTALAMHAHCSVEVVCRLWGGDALNYENAQEWTHGPLAV